MISRQLAASLAFLAMAATAACDTTVVHDDDGTDGTTDDGAGASGEGAAGAGGDGGSGGSVPGVCPQPAQLGWMMGGSCDANQAGLECYWYYADTSFSGGGVAKCEAGIWQTQQCPNFYTLGCPSPGSALGVACSSAWEQVSCSWHWLDAGGDCGGPAECVDGQWIAGEPQ